MKVNLFQIQNEYLQLAEVLLNNEGELTPELETALAINKDQLQAKGSGYGFVIKDFEAEIDIIDSEIKRLTELKKQRNNAIERLKTTLSTAMQVFEIDELKTPLIKINFRNSESVEIDNLAQLDQKFMVEKVTITPNKGYIKECIKAGEPLEGARLVQNKNLQIK